MIPLSDDSVAKRFETMTNLVVSALQFSAIQWCIPLKDQYVLWKDSTGEMYYVNNSQAKSTLSIITKEVSGPKSDIMSQALSSDPGLQQQIRAVTTALEVVTKACGVGDWKRKLQQSYSELGDIIAWDGPEKRAVNFCSALATLLVTNHEVVAICPAPVEPPATKAQEHDTVLFWVMHKGRFDKKYIRVEFTRRLLKLQQRTNCWGHGSRILPTHKQNYRISQQNSQVGTTDFSKPEGGHAPRLYLYLLQEAPLLLSMGSQDVGYSQIY